MSERSNTLHKVVTYWKYRSELQKLREARARGEESISDNDRSQRKIQRRLISLRRKLQLDGGNDLTAVIDDTVERERR